MDSACIPGFTHPKPLTSLSYLHSTHVYLHLHLPYFHLHSHPNDLYIHYTSMHQKYTPATLPWYGSVQPPLGSPLTHLRHRDYSWRHPASPNTCPSFHPKRVPAAGTNGAFVQKIGRRILAQQKDLSNLRPLLAQRKAQN